MLAQLIIRQSTTKTKSRKRVLDANGPFSGGESLTEIIGTNWGEANNESLLRDQSMKVISDKWTKEAFNCFEQSRGDWFIYHFFSHKISQIEKNKRSKAAAGGGSSSTNDQK